jgi:hypothetical protein
MYCLITMTTFFKVFSLLIELELLCVTRAHCRASSLQLRLVRFHLLLQILVQYTL